MTADKVVDASALAAAVFLEPRVIEASARLHGQNLAAPQIIRFEMANVCLKKIRSRPTERDTLLQQHAAYLSLPIDLHLIDHTQAIALAEQHGLSTYDASYLWLARQLGVELVTLDQRLQKASAKI